MFILIVGNTYSTCFVAKNYYVITTYNKYCNRCVCVCVRACVCKKRVQWPIL